MFCGEECGRDSGACKICGVRVGLLDFVELCSDCGWAFSGAGRVCWWSVIGYEQYTGHPYSNNSRSSHLIGRLVNLFREDDDFFELLSKRLLVGPVHSTMVRAAAVRLLLACVSSWLYPHVFEEEVLVNIKRWVTEDSPKDIANSRASRSKRTKDADAVHREMLRTYSTGLLAVTLGGSDVVEDVLTTGMVGQLMHYLRVRVLGDASAEANTESKTNIGMSGSRGRDEARGRVRPLLDVSRMEDLRVSDKVSDEQRTERGGEMLVDAIGEKKDNEEAVQEDAENLEGTPDLSLCTYDADEDGDECMNEDKRRRKDRREAKTRTAEWLNSTRPLQEDENEEMSRAEPSKRRIDVHRVGGKGRGKGRHSDGAAESERGQSLAPTSAPTSARKESGHKSRGLSSEKTSKLTGIGSEAPRGGVKDDSDSENQTIQCVLVGKADISLSMRKAMRAAQAEARTENAPWEAVKAAGDAAADLVRAAATEVLATTDKEEDILAAANEAALTVVDAALSSTVTREQLEKKKMAMEEAKKVAEIESKKEQENEVGDEGQSGVDMEALAALRERYCVQCLEKMGEYLEVLGPVLHERGVDVCLALLQRRPIDNNYKDLAVLSDVLKLICALAAHRKFAALFVDRGGVEQLLATPRVSQTLTGISLCLFALASLQGVMERVCTLPAPVVQDVVALALHLLSCPQDPARRNAALFFGASFVFRAILEAFDGQDGLRKIVNLLRNTASLRSGGSSNSGTAATSAGSRDRTLASAEVLTSSGKQIAYLTCVALRQYFRAHLLLLVDSLRPSRGHKGGSRNGPNGKATYKPLDISNEAMDTIIVQLQRDRKLGPAFVRSRWPPLDAFMQYNGHIVLLELTQQAAPGERYLHEIVQHSLGVLQIVTLVPYTRRLIIDSTLSNERSFMAVVLDAVSGVAFCDPEVIQTALLVLANLVCPPPSLCSRPMAAAATPAQSQQAQSSQGGAGSSSQATTVGTGTAVNLESKGWTGRAESNVDRNGGAQGASGPSAFGAGVVGDRRISLGPGAGGSGLAAYMEQGYRYAREAVRANNGIKVLLHLLYPRTVLPPPALDCIRALSCRVLLGLARDDTIAHILTKLQVGKLLSELLRDGGSQAGRQASAGGIGGEQGRWQAELSRVALELIAIVTNVGRANTAAASEAAAPTLRRIERAAIAAATPISYHPRELLQLIHEHLIGSGLPSAAAALLKEANLKPLPSLLPPTSLVLPASSTEVVKNVMQWPAGRVNGGFLGGGSKKPAKDEDDASSSQSLPSSRKKPAFSTSLTSGGKSGSAIASLRKSQSVKENRSRLDTQDYFLSQGKPRDDTDSIFKTPGAYRNLPVSGKRKSGERDMPPLSPTSKRMAFTDPFMASPCVTPGHAPLKTNFVDVSAPVQSTPAPSTSDFTPAKSFFGQYGLPEKVDTANLQTDSSTFDFQHSPYVPFKQYLNTPGYSLVPSTGGLLEPRTNTTEHATLDSLVVQYLKHQHRQCPAPITTLPPLSLLHPHVCPEPSRALDAPLNTASRLAVRQISPPYGGMHGRRRDRHFVYSRFRPWRTCRDDAVLLTANTFLGHASCLAIGSLAGDIRLFDSSSGNILEVQLMGHNSPITALQSAPHCLAGNDTRVGQLLLSSASHDVRLWDSSNLGNGPLHAFDSCKAARFNHAGSRLGAITCESPHKAVLLYDVGSYRLEQRLSDSSISQSGLPRSHTQSIVHFSPDDVLVLWSGVLWDPRVQRAIHRFDQFTDYGGGGFHPAGNEVIINSEVWDLRSYKLLRSVPSLDQTAITFNTTGDVIYATLRRNSDDIMTALNPRRMRHPLFSAFRTMDAVDYSDITTTIVDRCVLDLATEPTDSFISIVAVESNDEMDSFARLYEVGRRRPTDDDSDPDDGGETEEEEDDEDDDDDDGDLHEDDDIDLISNDNDENSEEDDGDEAGDNDSISTDDDFSDDGLGEGDLELISDGDDGPRGTFSSDDGSGGEFGQDAFDEFMGGFLS
ncbi:DDB1- and CUL4-associated factor homolog 1 isoform X1 [Physcomitrium patens]|uniref:LisH domain-containing protein n=1 Tax=Physcomitrium patens TaxID=3218 RepID=A0A7I4D6G2_PHYPA|nr:DDB1- and CUL4-associated factor homolog 1-like isoform X1 [Physcomitrium patens]|eukprot:XP_024402964.1 DDB1- and CUL4-associated factor homolog 1-like isoform X1 [Physcomitrella patens]